MPEIKNKIDSEIQYNIKKRKEELKKEVKKAKSEETPSKYKKAQITKNTFNKILSQSNSPEGAFRKFHALKITKQDKSNKKQKQHNTKNIAKLKLSAKDAYELDLDAKI